jgi:hypothetical protein
MRPDSVYIFNQCQNAHTRYKLHEHRGIDIPNFPAQWAKNCKGGKAGEKYIGFRETVEHRPGHRQFRYTLERDSARVVTGFDFAPDFPRRAFGDYGGDALLIEFSDDTQRLTIMFFKGQKHAAQALFQSWVAGETAEMAADALPLAIKKAG